MLKMIYAACLLFLLGFAAAESQYDDYQVIKVKVDELNVKHFEHVYALVEKFHMDVWGTRFDLGEIDLMIHRNERALFKGYNTTVLYDDVQAYLDQSPLVDFDHEAEEDNFYTQYRSYDDQMKRMQDLCTKHSSICKVFTMGKTLENRDILGVHIEGGSNGKEVLYNGNIHAREWVSPMTVLYIAEQLMVQYDSSDAVKRLVDNLKWTVVPVLNVDGRLYSQTTSRMWRKNRRRNNGGSYGVDLNRNFDYMWNKGGSSSNPSSDAYHGTAPLSEPESTVLREYACKQNGRVAHHIDFHTHGNMFMSSWGYTGSLPSSYNEMMNMARPANEAIQKTYNTRWALGSIYNVIYQASGGTTDTMLQMCKVDYSFAFELRGPGFSPPASAIQLSCNEVWNGVLSMGGYLVNKYTV